MIRRSLGTLCGLCSFVLSVGPAGRHQLASHRYVLLRDPVGDMIPNHA